ncbi:D-aminopeptidase [Sinirhodobacter populi]|uniref:D-aminopeptidase n=1 Tax=Paenirhodobacter populi TaxID=2306993 RepID=A0A443JEL7_9RHOB|nr:D-aminopeptidase [Sinirhodobacter populi]
MGRRGPAPSAQAPHPRDIYGNTTARRRFGRSWKGALPVEDFNAGAVEAVLDSLPKTVQGPGGVAGVVKDGRIVAARAWGYADLTDARPMTAATRMPICSISKQFTCGTLLATAGGPEVFDDRLKDYLPRFEGALPTVRQLCDNQSGLRDYWALTVLHGARAEQEFRREDALPLIARMRTGHFAPGTQYSYCNCNFRILGEMIMAHTGRGLEDLYREHIWGPAGMETAVLTADTRAPVDGVVGYEGSADHGYLPADNGIYWIGDAGISASLNDMLAYEAWIDATRDDPQSIYRRLSGTPHFADGTRAWYGYGLAHERIGDVDFTGHGGALRGFRAHRMNARSARLSVVVMLNHEADAHACAARIARAALGLPDPAEPPMPEGWDGLWLDRDRGMIARIVTDRTSARLFYATGPVRLLATEDGALAAPNLRVERDGAGLRLAIAGENTLRHLEPLDEIDAADGAAIAGEYETDELEARLRIEARDGGVFARFEGMLGQGRMEQMIPVAQDIWAVVTRRSMDAPAPGIWTFRIARDAAGQVTGGTLGCWLARGIGYRRIGG